MNLLEAEPEEGGRWKRVGIGGGVAVVLAASAVIGAQHVVPAMRELQSVVGITVIDDSPVEPPKDEPPPEETPPEPEPPKPREQAAPQPAVAPQPQARPEAPQQETVGLDSDSFGSGTGGAAFAVGNTQMGTPVGAGGTGGSGPVADTPAPRVAARLVEAKPHAGNPQPPYTARARRLAIEGLLIVEVDVDENGKVTRTIVRKPLEPELDKIAQDTLAQWSFDPAQLAGKAVASTKFIRLRFALD